jgi:hypothetical protein
MPGMQDRQPGERPDPRPGRTLDAPPSARYTRPAADGAGEGQRDRASAAGPVVRAGVAAVIGAAALVVVGAVLASTAGLLFVSGVIGAAVGLILARARVSDDARTAALSSRTVTWLAIGLTVAAILVADAGTWLIARGEGGVLGPLDYLLETFGPFVPGELVVGGIGAAWGAASGPIQG